MTLSLVPIKPTLLACAIALGLGVPGSPLYAGPTEKLVVAGGCFWCVESDFEKVKGVEEVVSGFAGGKTANPTYEQVTRGGTGHYEAAEITFDAEVVSRAQLLHMFMRSIDPTDAGGQFCDRGDSYRTAIFADGPEERAVAEKAVTEAQAALGQKIVTPVLNEGPFYPADAYHQDYYRQTDRILSRFGLVTKADAYEGYRKGCGRDKRVRQLWGSAAPFAAHPAS